MWCTGAAIRGITLGGLALAHGLTFDLDSIGIIDNPVTDGIGQGQII